MGGDSMSPAPIPREPRDAVRLLVLDPDGAGGQDHAFHKLPELLQPGDLLVLNDAATLPASLRGETDRGEPVEIRLATRLGPGRWRAVLFGAGDWRTPTEHRPPPPRLNRGDWLQMGELCAMISGRSSASSRLVELQFDRKGVALWDALYRVGRPVQYSHLRGDLEIWSVQTVYASRPWAVELPSAGRALTWRLLQALTDHGIEIATLTHAAGLSATGDVQLDATLPFPERYEIPPATAHAIDQAHRTRGRVIAVGTTVVRALEGNAHQHGGQIVAGSYVTDLVLTGDTTLRVVDGLLTGIHEPGESHFHLLRAFASRATLESGLALAARHDYQTHEFGDACLIVPRRATAA